MFGAELLDGLASFVGVDLVADAYPPGDAELLGEADRSLSGDDRLAACLLYTSPSPRDRG